MVDKNLLDVSVVRFKGAARAQDRVSAKCRGMGVLRRNGLDRYEAAEAWDRLVA